MNKMRAAIDGNEAAARISYLMSEVIAIYPITPSSPMGELADEWAAAGKPNLFGIVPDVYEMQSEAGAAGAVHGALTAGAQSVTFTASQGLLLMIPNMYKIAAELTPSVFQVSARALSCQALSIFGDHSDVMAVRHTGFGMVCAGNPQEVMDLSVITVRTAQRSRLPFVHFFDGFRTSHEIRTIETVPAEFLWDYLDSDDWLKSRRNALDPHTPTVRGTAENPDVYFQGRERVNPYYQFARKEFLESSQRLAELTGRTYQAFNYVGPDAPESLIIVMGSAGDTVEEVIRYLMQSGDHTCGLVKVRLYRPFCGDLLVSVVPPSIKRIAVLDRTKEPGSLGEPLYLEVVGAFGQAASGINGSDARKLENMPLIIGGRYGLGSKEFTPAMVKGIFDHLRQIEGEEKRWTGFTVGIEDDVTKTSIEYNDFHTENPDSFRGKFYGLGADGTVSANKNSIKIIADHSDNFCQGYFVYDSKKAGARTISHLRFSKDPILSCYLISRPNFVAVHNEGFLTRLEVLEGIEEGATFLLNSRFGPGEVFATVPRRMQQTIIERKLRFFTIDATQISEEVGLRGRINIAMQAAFFKVADILPEDVFTAAISEAIEDTYGKQGEEVVSANRKAMELALTRVFEVQVPAEPVGEGRPLFGVDLDKLETDRNFVEQMVAPVLADKGDSIPVSALPPDGAIPLGTSALEKRSTAIWLPEWHPELCIQCNFCSFHCPHATILPKLIEQSSLDQLAPEKRDEFAVLPATGYKESKELLFFRIQVAPDDCTGCGACASVCLGVERNPETKKPTGNKALMMRPKEQLQAALRRTYQTFQELPETPREHLHPTRMKDVQFHKPLFEFSGACAGCGETPYIKLITQLYGDRIYIANATGCSSIYGGTMPVVPYTKTNKGEGPAWQSSLFEDNAEFGFGIRAGSKKLHEMAAKALGAAAEAVGRAFPPRRTSPRPPTPEQLALCDLLSQLTSKQREQEYLSFKQVQMLKEAIVNISGGRGPVLSEAEGNARPTDLSLLLADLESLASHLMQKITFIIGGDGWAYDIGYGGVDHVLASGEDVNLLVLDTGVYSNTGGQRSKATPMGAVTKFASGGKRSPRKDLGLMAMCYKDVYVAQVSYGANPAFTQLAIQKAVEFPGSSLILAYSPCTEHGYALDRAPLHCKMAAQCGLWPLYRYDPGRREAGQNPLVLETRELSLKFREYANHENRFRRLFRAAPDQAEQVLAEAEKRIEEDFAFLKKLAEMNY